MAIGRNTDKAREKAKLMRDTGKKITDLKKELSATEKFSQRINREMGNAVKELPPELVGIELSKAVKMMRKSTKELLEQIGDLKDPKDARMFKCRKGHTHFTFDCEGCEAELEWMKESNPCGNDHRQWGGVIRKAKLELLTEIENRLKNWNWHKMMADQLIVYGKMEQELKEIREEIENEENQKDKGTDKTTQTVLGGNEKRKSQTPNSPERD